MNFVFNFFSNSLRLLSHVLTRLIRRHGNAKIYIFFDYLKMQRKRTNYITPKMYTNISINMGFLLETQWCRSKACGFQVAYIILQAFVKGAFFLEKNLHYSHHWLGKQ